MPKVKNSKAFMIGAMLRYNDKKTEASECGLYNK
jgi:hypothetical protein